MSTCLALPAKPHTGGLGEGRLGQIVAYGRRVFDLEHWLGCVEDQRRKPQTTPRTVAAAVFFAGLLRIRSFNALEPRLKEKSFRRLVRTGPNEGLNSIDTLGRALRVMDLEGVRALSVKMLRQAERNKVFREGWHGALRYFAIDGWEPFCSRHRHCNECLVRKVRIKRRDGSDELMEVEEYYHRYAVALLIDARFDLLLDFEPLLPKDLRPVVAKKGKRNKPRLSKPDVDEGELTAATRLLKRVKASFPWLDVVIADSLYANGPFLDAVSALGLGAVVIAKKQTDEPLKDALQIWGNTAAQTTIQDEKARELIELWDCQDLETLRSYHGGKIRCVRARVSNLAQPKQAPSTWCMLVTGDPQRRLSAHKVLAVARARWHIENTGFHQWTTRWRFSHVFTHYAHAIRALFWLFFAAFNLLTLFLYRQLRCYGRDRGKDVTRTISRLIDEMLDDLARLAPDTS